MYNPIFLNIFLQAKTSGGIMPQILFFGAMISVAYFFLIRPQGERDKKLKQYIDTIIVGQQVVTVGGIHGTVTRVDAESFSVRIDKMTTVKVEKDGIAVEKTQKLASNSAKPEETAA